MKLQTLIQFEQGDLEYEELKHLLSGLEGLGKRPAIAKALKNSDRDFAALNQDWLYGRQIHLRLLQANAWHDHQFLTEVMDWLSAARQECAMRVKPSWWVETCGVKDPDVAVQCASAFINLVPRIDRAREIIDGIRQRLLRRPVPSIDSRFD